MGAAGAGPYGGHTGLFCPVNSGCRQHALLLAALKRQQSEDRLAAACRAVVGSAEAIGALLS